MYASKALLLKCCLTTALGLDPDLKSGFMNVSKRWEPDNYMAPTPWGRSAPQPKTCGGAIIFAPPHKRMTVHSARRAPSWINGEREGRGRVGKGGGRKGDVREGWKAGIRKVGEEREGRWRMGWVEENGREGWKSAPYWFVKVGACPCVVGLHPFYTFSPKKLACNSQATTHKGGIGLHDGRSQLSDCCHYALGRCKRTYSPCYWAPMNTGRVEEEKTRGGPRGD